MDRGRQRDDGPEDVEAAPDRDTLDLTAEAAGPPEADPRLEPEADGMAEETDDRPAAWLADVRARAPWLLEPGGALHASAAGRQGPDEVPHGSGSARLSFDAADAVHAAGPGRVDPTSSPGSWPEDARGGIRPVDHITAGGAGPPASAGGPRGPGDAPTPSPVVLHPPGPAIVPDPVGEARPNLAPPPEPATHPGTTGEAAHPSPAPAWPADDERVSTAGTGSIAPEPATREDGPPAPPSDPWSILDARRPAIHRPSATWPPPPAPASAATPVWPPRPHPEGTGLPRPGPIPEPSRPPDRPVTPFVTDRPASASTTRRFEMPTWADDRSGWHAAANPATRIVAGAALPPWPSLLDDDDGDEDGPDWAILERGFDRKLRLDREQRRR